ncbi:MAG TPA: RodZ domain-containing protein [Acidimicrobiales bacterium]|nr:RodZ domain-containing protein [Acidimicrobiales bacterium]
MPGRPRNDDRRAIEAFARIHQGTAGSTRSSHHRTSLISPDASRFVPDFGPAEPSSNGYAALAVLPNLERPRIGRRILIAATATAIVLVAAFGVAGATGTKHRGSAKLAAEPAAATPGASRTGRRSAPVTTTTAGNGPVSPTSSSPTEVSFVLPASAGPLMVTIAAVTGPCWAEAGTTSGGPLSWAGTIGRGQQQVLTPGAQWWLRLGAPEYVTVTVNGRQLELPVTSQPLNLSITTS